MKINIPNIEALSDAAQAFLNNPPKGNIWAFRGEMGAGKTTFISALCRQLGVEDDVSSPTFSIVNEYFAPSSDLTLYHFDCYRIKDLEEALDFGIEDYFESGRLCIIEWPENVEPLLPENVANISISLSPEGRTVEYIAANEQ